MLFMSSSSLNEVRLWTNTKEREKYENLAGGKLHLPCRTLTVLLLFMQHMASHGS